MKLLSMSGFIPEEICDTVRFNGYAGSPVISNYCGYAADFIGRVISDEAIDGAVFPHTCDSSRSIMSYLGECGKFLHQINVPIRKDNAAIAYFAAVIREYQSAVERHFGVEIKNVRERAELVNGRNAQIRKLYDNLENIRFSEYLKMLHEMLEQPLDRQTVQAPSGQPQGKRVMLVGSYLCDVSVAEVIEKNGIAVVADDLPESGRLALRPCTDASGDIYSEIARSMLCGRHSPTQNDFRRTIADDLAEIRKKAIRAVIFVTVKHCEPYDYLYSVYKKILDENGIPSLKLTVANSHDRLNSELMIESFADMI